MSLVKAIKSGKEHRKEYIGKNYCKSVDKHCRNHGGRRHSWECQWCLDNRTKKNKEKEKLAKEEVKAYTANK
jgi:hypothetical protein